MVPDQYTSARGRKNLAALVFLAAEFFTNIFSDLWTKQIKNIKHSQSKKKISSIEKIDYNIYAGIIKNLQSLYLSLKKFLVK